MRRHLAPALVGLTVLTASACGSGGAGSGDPVEDFSAAMTSLQSSDFAWTLTIDASNSALTAAAEQEPMIGQASLFIGSLEVSGASVGDNKSFELGLMGATVIEARLLDDDKLYLRTEAADLLANFGVDPEDALSGLGAQGMPDKVSQLVTSALAGEWVGFEIDLDGLADAAGADAPEQAAQFGELVDALSGMFADPAELLQRIGTVTASDGEDGAIVYDVAISPRAAADFFLDEVAPKLADAYGEDAAADLADARAELEDALEGAPSSVPGLRVTVRDGDVVQLLLDIDELVAALGEPLGNGEQAAIVVDITRDDLPSIDEPATSTFLTTDDLTQLGELFATMA